MNRDFLSQPNHPIGILATKINSLLPDFKYILPKNPIVSLQQNFDHLLIPASHPSRSKCDTYYVDKNLVLRTHTSAHQSEILTDCKDDAYLVAADCYRRDEIDTTHYPVFHQMEGIKLWKREQLVGLEDNSFSNPFPFDKISANNPIQPFHTCEESSFVGGHLRYTLETLIRNLLNDSSLKIRWVDAYFPFTSPSWEMEIFYNNEWLEILGCGVMQQKILNDTGNEDKIGWAFGLGLERIAMVLFDIPDIRLFWSTDPRFLSQFQCGKITKFKPFSKYRKNYLF
jgi:phenylalanyl-tRNA synthetase alpha chain